MKKQILIIFGTRPEAIKLAPIYRAFCSEPDIEPIIWLTGQHQEMLQQVMKVFELTAERNFQIMTSSQSLTGIVCRVLSEMEKALNQKRPDLIIVQGDTSTAFAASLSAFYQKIPVAHIEAGLRTEDKFSPYPEELNRRLTSIISDYHFAPTLWAKNNLLKEGVPEDKIWVTGNTVIDALDYTLNKVRSHRPPMPPDFPLEELESNKKLILITGHRRENFGLGLEQICQAIAQLSDRYPDVLFVYPVHMNPNVRDVVFNLLGDKNNISLLEPLSYQSFVWAMAKCYFLITDSGGIQEEAPHLGKPVLIMRDSTERPEAIEAGTAKLVGTECDNIVREAANLLDDPESYLAMSTLKNPFGDGQAAKRIKEICLRDILYNCSP